MKNDFTATEIRAGILVLISFFILVGFVAAIRGCRPQDDTAKQYIATFTDISGLNHRADVRFGGVRVGRVIAIIPDPTDHSIIRVTAEVSGDIPVNAGSVAKIAQISLTAEKHLEISTGDPEARLHKSGETISSYTSSGGFIDMPDLDGLTLRLEALLDSLTVLLGGEPIGKGFGEEGRDIVDLAELSASLDETLKASTGTVREVNSMLAENRQGIEEVVSKLVILEETATQLMVEISAVVTENREPLHATVSNLQILSEEASAGIEDLVASLKVTLQHLQDTGANTSDLIDDQRQTIEEILFNLQETTRNLRDLSRILAEQPNSLIRGAKPQGRKNQEAR